MMCNNPKQDLATMNADMKFGEILTIGSKYIEQKQNFGEIKGHNSGTNVQKMTCNNPKLSPVNMNTFIKFGENMSVSSEDIEQKQNFGVNKRS